MRLPRPAVLPEATSVPLRRLRLYPPRWSYRKRSLELKADIKCQAVSAKPSTFELGQFAKAYLWQADQLALFKYGK